MLTDWHNIEDLVRRLDPPAVGRFLVRNGYKLTGSDPGRAEVYAGKGGELLIIPTDKDLNDYTRRMAELVGMFATDGLTFDDVLTLMVLPESDVLRYSIDTPDTTWGNLRLTYGYEAMHALA